MAFSEKQAPLRYCITLHEVVSEGFPSVQRGKDMKVKDNGSPSHTRLLCQAPGAHFCFSVTMKARENTLCFRQFLYQVPTWKDELRRPIYPANVPLQVRNNYLPWHLRNLYRIPVDYLWIVIPSHSQRLHHSRWAYLFICTLRTSPLQNSF